MKGLRKVSAQGTFRQQRGTFIVSLPLMSSDNMLNQAEQNPTQLDTEFLWGVGEGQATVHYGCPLVWKSMPDSPSIPSYSKCLTALWVAFPTGVAMEVYHSDLLQKDLLQTAELTDSPRYQPCGSTTRLTRRSHSPKICSQPMTKFIGVLVQAIPYNARLL